MPAPSVRCQGLSCRRNNNRESAKRVREKRDADLKAVNDKVIRFAKTSFPLRFLAPAHTVLTFFVQLWCLVTSVIQRNPHPLLPRPTNIFSFNGIPILFWGVQGRPNVEQKNLIASCTYNMKHMMSISTRLHPLKCEARLWNFQARPKLTTRRERDIEEYVWSACRLLTYKRLKPSSWSIVPAWRALASTSARSYNKCRANGIAAR